MSVKRKSKDHQKAHKGVELVPAAPPRSADPLMFWTNHPTENTLIDLRPFAHGTSEMGELAGGLKSIHWPSNTHCAIGASIGGHLRNDGL